MLNREVNKQMAKTIRGADSQGLKGNWGRTQGPTGRGQGAART